MGVHPTAIVEDGAVLGADVEIGPYAVVRAGTVLGDGVSVGEHAVLGKRPKLGPRSTAAAGELGPPTRSSTRAPRSARARSSATRPSCASAAGWARAP